MGRPLNLSYGFDASSKKQSEALACHRPSFFVLGRALQCLEWKSDSGQTGELLTATRGLPSFISRELRSAALPGSIRWKGKGHKKQGREHEATWELDLSAAEVDGDVFEAVKRDLMTTHTSLDGSWRVNWPSMCSCNIDGNIYTDIRTHTCPRHTVTNFPSGCTYSNPPEHVLL